MNILSILTPERERSSPFFHDEGKYTLLTDHNVESGKFIVNTCLANQFDKREWESLFRLQPDYNLTQTADKKRIIPEPYTSAGEVIRLWEENIDPTGIHAKLVHNKIVELVQRNLPYDELKQQLRDYLREVRQEM